LKIESRAEMRGSFLFVIPAKAGMTKHLKAFKAAITAMSLRRLQPEIASRSC
jgi:hypothetical protein